MNSTDNQNMTADDLAEIIEVVPQDTVDFYSIIHARIPHLGTDDVPVRISYDVDESIWFVNISGIMMTGTRVLINSWNTLDRHTIHVYDGETVVGSIDIENVTVLAAN